MLYEYVFIIFNGKKNIVKYDEIKVLGIIEF